MTRSSWITAAAAVIAMFWLAKDGDDWSKTFLPVGQQADYYNLLVDGFQDGHLHLKTEVHPDLLSPDIEVRSRAPYLLDAGLFQGRYYLYYGVVPAVVLLLPYSVLTGHDLPLVLATLAFVLIGFSISLLWYREIRNHSFPNASRLMDQVAVLLLAFGPATGFLIRRSMFYELPLAAGYAFLAGFVFSITRALTLGTRRIAWVGAASTCVGFAAGCHPNYALLSVLVAVVAVWNYRDESLHWGRDKGRILRLVAAAVIPAAMLGGALALYNYARFGNPLEFGFKYGVNVFFTTNDRLLGLDFIWPNLKWYYLTPPTLLPYFPFIFPADATFRPEGYHGAEPIHGQFLVFITLIWIGVGLIGRRIKTQRAMRRLSWVLGAAFAISAGFIFLFGIRANRYLVDFQLPLIFLGLLGALHASEVKQPGRNGWQILLLVLSLVVSVSNVLAAVQQFDDFRNRRPVEFAHLSRLLNPSWAFWETLGLVKTGTLELDVTFKAQQKAVGEPLVTVGVPGYSDCVYAIQHPGNHVEFLIDHHGYGGPKSRLFSYEPGRSYRIQIELGAFYPPATDPYYSRGSRETLTRIKTTARVVFDGKTAINQSMPLYDAAPWQRELGSNLISHTLFSTVFSGQILRHGWTPPQQPSVEEAGHPKSSVIRLSLGLPQEMPTVSQPLVGFGLTGTGTLLFLRPDAPGQWTLLADEWGYPVQPGIPVKLEPGRHSIELFVGPLLPFDSEATASGLATPLQSKQNQIIVWIDGQLIGRLLLTRHLEAFSHVVLGTNAQGFSTADTYFYGSLGKVDLAPDERGALLRLAAEVP